MELSISLKVKEVFVSVSNKERCRSVGCVLFVLEISPTHWSRNPGRGEEKTSLGNNICSKDANYSFTTELDAGKEWRRRIASTRRRSGMSTPFWDPSKTAKYSAFKMYQSIC